MDNGIEDRSKWHVDSWGAQSASDLFGLLLFGFAGALALGFLGHYLFLDVSGVLAFIGFIAGMVMRGGLQYRKAHRLNAQVIDLQSQLDQLKQQDFELRYQEAKERGDLDQFGDPK